MSSAIASMRSGSSKVRVEVAMCAASRSRRGSGAEADGRGRWRRGGRCRSMGHHLHPRRNVGQIFSAQIAKCAWMVDRYTPGCPGFPQTRVAGETYPCRVHPVVVQRRPGSRSKPNREVGAIVNTEASNSVFMHLNLRPDFFTVASSVARLGRKPLRAVQAVRLLQAALPI